MNGACVALTIAARRGDGVQPVIAPVRHEDVWPTNNNREQRSKRRNGAIAVELTNHLDR
jgi:hypothetical protein